MKVIALENKHGEKIEIKRGDDGVVRIRHSDFTGDEWGEFYPDGMPILKDPALAANVAAKGMDAAEALEVVDKLGIGYMTFKGDMSILSHEEIEMIKAALPDLG